jgi:hypothetical protein
MLDDRMQLYHKLKFNPNWAGDRMTYPAFLVSHYLLYLFLGDKIKKNNFWGNDLLYLLQDYLMNTRPPVWKPFLFLMACDIFCC